MHIMISVVVGAGAFKLYRLWRRRGQASAAGVRGTPSVGLNGALVEPRR